jgi:hypothetical protein
MDRKAIGGLSVLRVKPADEEAINKRRWFECPVSFYHRIE